MPKVTTRDGVNLHVNDVGRGRPVILIHGWPLNADSWEYQTVALVEAGFRVIAYDRRGFGRSDQPGWGYDYNTLAHDLEAVIEQADARGATIVGFSMGGGEVARYLGMNGPRGVSKAVLIGSVVPGLAKSDDNPEGLPPEAAKEMLDGLKKDRPHFLSGFLKKFYGVGVISKPVSQEILDWSLSGAMMASPIATLQCVHAFTETNFTRDLSGFGLPTLAIHGTADENVPIDPSTRRFKKLVPHAEVIEYDGAPHGLTATHTEKLNADLIAFLKR